MLLFRQFYTQVDQYITLDKQCLICNGNVYQFGTICCSNSQYINYASTSVTCTKVATGQCSSLTLMSRFKICCPNSQSYNFELKRCVPPTNFNCDNEMKICCNNPNKLQYLNETDEYKCLPICKWSSLNNLQCIQNYCNANLVLLVSSEASLKYLYSSAQFKANNSLLLTLNGQCCYGVSTISSNSTCYKTQVDCGVRFANLGWTICCASGLFYSVDSKICMSTCSGFILFEMLCLTNNTILNLAGLIPSSTTTTTCNGLTLPSQIPVCCPSNFYISGRQGCKLCLGSIHRVSISQICCLSNEYYDKSTSTCKVCAGIVDLSGTLCCFSNQYFKYTSLGVSSCVGTCNLDNIYLTQTCCESLTVSSCQNSNFKPTQCSDEYFVTNTCQGCPNFCSNTAQCTIGDVMSCSKVCAQNSVYNSSLDLCLDCDSVCQQCSFPMDNKKCIGCVNGYVLITGICVACNIDCQTCSLSRNNCTSCYANGPKPYLLNGNCLPLCSNGSFFDSTANQCTICNFNCVQCLGSSSSQCSKCPSGLFVGSLFSGTCSNCGNQCQQCFNIFSSCILCSNGYQYYQNTRSCVFSCASNQISSLLGSPIMQVCLPCHTLCKTCSLTVENCLTCSNSQYLSNSIGLNLCLPCISPCKFCSSVSSCSSCVDGHYFNPLTLKCLPCYSQCLTCMNANNNGCLSCFGDSILLEGKCVGCSASCLKCDALQNCVQCKSGLFLYQGACISGCPDGYYSSDNSTCLACYSLCKTCSNGLINGCLSCQIPLILTNRQCLGCQSNCQICNANLTCTICNNGLFLYKTSCLSKCPGGYFGINSICEICPLTCTNCISLTICTQCAVLTPILYNSQCIINCPSGYQLKQTSNTCSPINNTNPNFTVLYLPLILYETLILGNSQSIGYLNLYFAINSTNEQIQMVVKLLKFYLLNLNSGVTKQIDTVLSQTDYLNKKAVFKVGAFPSFSLSEFDATLITVNNFTISTSQVRQSNVVQQNSSQIKQISATSLLNSSSYQSISSKFVTLLLVPSYSSETIYNLKFIGMIISLILWIYAILCKQKSHFLAQQANCLVLHFLNFTHVIYLFKYVQSYQQAMYGFLEGFNFAMFGFFPNFFSTLIPSDYVEIINTLSLVPDGNLIRNAGFLYSYQLVVIGTFILVFLAFLIWSCLYQYDQIYQIRKLMRMGIFLVHVCFLPLLFFSFQYLSIPSAIQPQYQNFHVSNIILSYISIFTIVLLFTLIFWHFYFTYNSDVLQNFYTLREICQYIQIFFQSVILCMSIDRPLICLSLIPLEFAWLLFNYWLYKYGEGYTLTDFVKFIVTSILISICYLFLLLQNYLPWIFIVIVISFVSFALLFYGGYQVVGLYYHYFFNNKQQKSL